MLRIPGMRFRSLGSFSDEEIDPCVPGQQPGYDFDQDRKRCMSSDCPDPATETVAVYKGQEFCMKKADLQAGKKPCDVAPNNAVCQEQGGISTGEKVALGVAVVAILGLGYVALVKDWSKEK